MMKANAVIKILMVVVLIGICLESQGAIIVSDQPVMVYGPVSGPVTLPALFGSVITPAPDAGNQMIPDNLVILDGSEVYHDAMGPVDYVFSAENYGDFGGFTEYWISGNVKNNTGITWTGFVMELGFGIGDDFVLSSSQGESLDFDTVFRDTPISFGDFEKITHDDALLEWGNHTAQSSTIYNLNWQLSVHLPDQVSSPFSFTIRHTPVPEPSLAIVFLAGTVLFFRRLPK